MPSGVYKRIKPNAGQFKKGRKMVFSIEIRKKISIAKKGKSNGRKGKHHSEETKKKISQSEKGKEVFSKGEKHYKWIKDRSQLKKADDRRTTAYFEWRNNVFKRDNYKCKINNSDCKGRLEAHHIFRWIDYPELRYEISNGITLCHFHHPRKPKEEKILSPYFQNLISTPQEILCQN